MLVWSVTLAVALGTAVLWVGDMPWINDEPRLLVNAFHANRGGTLAQRGLRGNFGISYGPIATQLYQVMLLASDDLLTVAALRAASCALLTAAALLWLAQTLCLPRWFVLAIVLAPYVWHYHRVLWDASFAVPIGALALAAYAAFLRHRSTPALAVATVCTFALPLIHPQGLPLFVPIAGHTAWTLCRGAFAMGAWRTIAFAAGIVFVLNAAYLLDLAVAIIQQLGGAVSAGYPGTSSRVVAMFSPLLSGRLFEAANYAEANGTVRDSAQIFEVAALVSWVIYPLIWTGIIISGKRAVVQLAEWRQLRRLGEGSDQSQFSSLGVTGTRDLVLALAFVGLVLQVLLFGLMRIPAEPQYFFGTAALHILFAWIGVDALKRVRLCTAVISIYGVSVASITLLEMCRVHEFGHNRLPLPGRPTLRNQIEVARELNRYSDATVWTDVPLFEQYPQSLRSLRLLLPPPPQAEQRQSNRLLIRYQSGPHGRDSRVELLEVAPGADWPPAATRVDVTPLPRGWEPSR